MKKIIILLIVGVLAWKGYAKYQSHIVASASEQQEALVISESTPERKPEISLTTASYKCDGRVHCSQMTSCEEATFFLRNCPGVKMDGNNDGVPCEMQWCK